MSCIFPTNPVVNDTNVCNFITYIFDGYGWTPTGLNENGSTGSAYITVNTATSPDTISFKTGDFFTNALGITGSNGNITIDCGEI